MAVNVLRSGWVAGGDVGVHRAPARGTALAALLVFILAGGTSAIFLTTDGNLIAAAAFIASLMILVASCYRLDWGLYLLVGMVLLFDQYYIPGFTPVTFTVSYFLNLKEIPYLPSVDAAYVNPLELQMFLLVVLWILTACVKKERIVRPVANWPAALLFFFALLVAFANGLRRGGEFLPALWEVRAFFYLGFLYLFVPQIIQTKKQIRTMMWVCIAAISFKALQGDGRFFSLGCTFAGYPTLTNHEDPVFFLDLIVFTFALVLFNAKNAQRTALCWLFPILVLGFFVGERRAAYAAIGPVVLAFVAVLPRREERLFLKVLLPAAFLAVIYCAAFWNSESKIASPVRLVKTGLTVDPEESGGRYYSNLYREIEKYDLASTVREVPLTGLGFGMKYEMPLPLVKIDFPLRDYIPHDEILWLIVKLGALGFVFFWFFIDSFAFRTASTLAHADDPYLRAFCVMAVAAVVNQIVVSSYDLQLTYYRNMVFLGTLMGLQSSIELLGRQASGRTSPAGEALFA